MPARSRPAGSMSWVHSRPHLREPAPADESQGPGAAPSAAPSVLPVGIAGFIPGVTTDVDTLQFAGHDSRAMLLGIFQVSILHNLVHILFGIAGLATAGSALASRRYLLIGGVVYLVLWIYGLFAAGDHGANVVPVNTADNWLHLGLAVAMILLGFFVGRDRRVRDARGEQAKPARS